MFFNSTKNTTRKENLVDKPKINNNVIVWTISTIGTFVNFYIIINHLLIAIHDANG